MRFVLPNIILLTLLAHKDLFGPNAAKWLKGVTIAHGILFFVILGVAHQGGMIRALATVQGTPTAPNHVIFYGTYQPPKHLLQIKENQPGTTVYDLKGEETSNIMEIRKTVLRIRESIKFNQQTDTILLLTPSSFDFEIKKIRWMAISENILSTSFNRHRRR